MRRREFITLAAGAAAAWLSHAQAQQPTMPTIGWLSLATEVSMRWVVEAFRSGLADLGYIEGKNIRILQRYADGNVDRLSALTGELVSLSATIIVTHHTTAIRAAHHAAPNIPIVSWVAGDPIMMGWAQTLARPGGMITGLFVHDSNLVKPFEVLKELRPQANTFGFLMNASNPGNPRWKRVVDDAAGALGIKVEIIEVKEPSEFADAFSRIKSVGVEGVTYTGDPVFASNIAAIAELARLHKFPSVGDLSGFISAGGLIAIGPNYVGMAKRSASFVDQILKGTARGTYQRNSPRTSNSSSI
jgi:putative ABC transport system substrate-binding protein